MADAPPCAPPADRDEDLLNEWLLAGLVAEADRAGSLQGGSASALLARLEAADPDWWCLAQLSEVEPESLGADDALAYLRVVSAHLAWLESWVNRALVAAAGPEPVSVRAAASDREVEVADVMREEVAAALRLAPTTAHGRIEAARALVAHLPETCRALQQGQITGMQARLVADAVRRAERPGGAGRLGEFARGLEQRVLPRAMRSTVGQTRAAVRAAARRLDPEGVAGRARAARADLDVRVWHDDEGVSTLSARLLTEQAVAVAAAIESLADDRGFRPDVAGESAGQRRSQALVALVLRPEGDRPGAVPAPHAGAGARASLDAGVVLVMDLPTWLGLRDDPVAVLGGSELPAEVARALAVDATFRRAITDPVTGHLLDYGRRAYAAPEPLRRYLLMRDQVCRFPGCSRGAEGCQADHAVAWDDGGTTSSSNLGMLCTRHHQLKTHAGWRLLPDDAGGPPVWVSPAGRRYVVDQPLLIEPEPDP